MKLGEQVFKITFRFLKMWKRILWCYTWHDNGNTLSTVVADVIL